MMPEVLHKLLAWAENQGLFSGLEIGRDKILLSHLQFADDTIIFCQAKRAQLWNVKKILLLFKELFGLMIKFYKSGLVVMGKDEHWA